MRSNSERLPTIEELMAMDAKPRRTLEEDLVIGYERTRRHACATGNEGGMTGEMG